MSQVGNVHVTDNFSRRSGGSFVREGKKWGNTKQQLPNTDLKTLLHLSLPLSCHAQCTNNSLILPLLIHYCFCHYVMSFLQVSVVLLASANTTPPCLPSLARVQSQLATNLDLFWIGFIRFIDWAKKMAKWLKVLRKAFNVSNWALLILKGDLLSIQSSADDTTN